MTEAQTKLIICYFLLLLLVFLSVVHTPIAQRLECHCVLSCLHVCGCMCLNFTAGGTDAPSSGMGNPQAMTFQSGHTGKQSCGSRELPLSSCKEKTKQKHTRMQIATSAPESLPFYEP